jgi:small conductance mechanosensitive channel
VLNTLGISIAPILGAAGVARVAIGFGAQSLVKDFFSGVFLLLENQIRVGDVVEIAGKSGVVESMTLRRIQLRSVDGAVHYVSNGLISTVTNFSTEFAYAVVDIGVAYREDIDRVFEVMRATAEGMRASEPFTKTVIGELEILGVDQWAESAIMIRCRMKTQPLQQWATRREFLKRLKSGFDQAGISIPYPHRTLVQDGGDTRTAPASSPKGD